MTPTRIAIAAALAAALAVPVAVQAQGNMEKCYGVAKAGKNDCQTAASSCAGTSKKDAQTDAVSAVSPYATSIDNFVNNQGTQFSHYTLQAAANAMRRSVPNAVYDQLKVKLIDADTNVISLQRQRDDMAAT